MKNIKTDDVYKMDQFFTKKEVAQSCLNVLKDIFDFNNFDCIIEPSAGEGSFFFLLPQDKRVGIELDGYLCLQYIEYDNKSFFDFEVKDDKNILTVGNPPFGTQNSLSVDFFNHAAKFSNVIAFIIPKTWNKKSIQNRLNENFHLIKSVDLEPDCFYGEKQTNVKCCFQVWQKAKNKRVKEKKILIHKDWDFLPYIKGKDDLEPPKEADFAILAYGSNPGQVSDNLFRWRPKSVHFIRSNIDVIKLISRFEKLDYSIANNSARQSSLCKEDLVKLYVEQYG